MRHLIPFLCIFFLILGCGRGKQSVDTGPEISRAELLLLHNIQRNAEDIPQLSHDPLLEEQSQKWAEWMAQNDNLKHSHLDLANTKFFLMGENIAMGYGSTDDVVKGWMDSPGHRKNIMNPKFTHAGFGYAKLPNGGAYWCAQFGGK